MKKRLLISVLGLFALGLTACGEPATTATTPATTTTDTATQPTTQDTTPETTTGDTTPETTTSQYETITSLNITNKDDLTKTWQVGQPNRSLNITTDPVVNVNTYVNKGQIKVTSSDPAVISVAGIYLQAVGTGSATITVTAGNVSDSVTINVSYVQTLLGSDNYVKVGETISFQIEADGGSETLADYDWSVDDDTKATIENGVLKGVAAGDVVVTAALKGSAHQKATFKVTVGEEDQVITPLKDVKGSKVAFKVKGIVGAITAKGFMVDDGTGAVYVYGVTKYASGLEIKKGEYVKVDGETSPYNGEMEFGNKSVVTRLAMPEGFKGLEAVELTKKISDSMAKAGQDARDVFTKYTYKTFLTTTDGTAAGYKCLSIVGSTVMIEISNYADAASLKIGSYYDVTGYIFGYNTSYKAADIMIDTIEVTVPTETVLAISATSGVVHLDVENPETLTLQAYAAAPEGQSAEITWETSNADLATVENGVVTPVGLGEVEIKAKAGDKEAICKVRIAEPVSYQKTTIAELLALGKNKTDMVVYEVTGILEAKKDDDAYGNGYLTDPATGDTIQIYGNTTTETAITEQYSGFKFSNPKDAKTTLADIKNGELITMHAVYTPYVKDENVTPEIVGVTVAHKAYEAGFIAVAGLTENGTVQLSKTEGIAYGEEITITATPAANYQVSSVKVDHGFKSEDLSVDEKGQVKFAATVLNKVQVEFAPAGGPVTEVITFSEKGYENQQAIDSVAGGDFTISFDKGTNSNAPKYYTTGAAIRVYGGNTFTFTGLEKVLVKIELVFSSGEGSNAITTDKETYENGTWTGLTSSVKFTVGGTSGHRRLAGVKVTTENAE